MIKYLGRFVRDLYQKSHQIRQLLKNDVMVNWTENMDKEFENFKDTVTNQPVLQFYDPTLPIKLSSDASRKGLGAILQQKHGSQWLAVAYTAGSLNKAETRYTTIALKTLGITFACTKFYQYIFGQAILIETDHKPLITIFSKSLNSLSSKHLKNEFKATKLRHKINPYSWKEHGYSRRLSRSSIDMNSASNEY